jgi:hypothetical protein
VIQILLIHIGSELQHKVPLGIGFHTVTHSGLRAQFASHRSMRRTRESNQLNY